MNTELIDNYLAEHSSLTLCDTTDNTNGYPSGLRKAIYGFDTIDEAKAAAEELGGELAYIDKRDGWQVWHRKLDWNPQPFTLTCEDLGYICESCDTEEFEETAKDELLAAIQGDKSLDEINDLMQDIIAIRETVDGLLDGEVVFYAKDGNFGVHEIVKKETLSYYYDTKTTTIAVVL